MIISNDDPQVLALLDAALNMQETPEDGLQPAYDSSALLVLADYLDDRGDERAGDVRQLARASFFLPGGGSSPYPRPIASGTWWNISSLCPGPSQSAVCWQVYPGTPQHEWMQVAWRSTGNTLGFHGPRRDDLWLYQLPYHAPEHPGGVLCVCGPLSASSRFEEVRLLLAAELMGRTQPWLQNRHKLFLQPDDRQAARCLGYA
jgi:hypothetical protein